MKHITKQHARALIKKHKLPYKLDEVYAGLNVELEHSNLTKGDVEKTLKIVLAHLRELPDYYTRLKKMERKKSMK